MKINYKFLSIKFIAIFSLGSLGIIAPLKPALAQSDFTGYVIFSYTIIDSPSAADWAFYYILLDAWARGERRDEPLPPTGRILQIRTNRQTSTQTSQDRASLLSTLEALKSNLINLINAILNGWQGSNPDAKFQSPPRVDIIINMERNIQWNGEKSLVLTPSANLSSVGYLAIANNNDSVTQESTSKVLQNIENNSQELQNNLTDLISLIENNGSNLSILNRTSNSIKKLNESLSELLKLSQKLSKENKGSLTTEQLLAQREMLNSTEKLIEYLTNLSAFLDFARSGIALSE